jgi:flagellar motor switch protein FliM
VSVEQLSFVEFTQCLPSPTVLISLGMKPFDSSAVLEMNPSVVFPLLEMLLGGNGKGSALKRETTEIEQSILDTLFRLILQDLKQAWHPVANINFSMDARETEPQLLQLLAPNEAVVSVGLEMRVGDHVGMMNIGLPSIMIKMLRHRFDQQWTMRKDSSEAEHARVLKLLEPTGMRLDARLEGPSLLVEDLMTIEPGQVLNFDYPVGKPLKMVVNGRAKFEGRLVASGNKKAFQVESRT